MAQYSAGLSVRGINEDQLLGLSSDLLSTDMGGFRINTRYPITVRPVASGTFSIAMGPYNSTTPADQTTASGLHAIAIGSQGCSAGGDYSIAIGQYTNWPSVLLTGDNSIAIGRTGCQADNAISINTSPNPAGDAGVSQTHDGAVLVCFNDATTSANQVKIGVGPGLAIASLYGIDVRGTVVGIGGTRYGADTATAIGVLLRPKAANQIWLGSNYVYTGNRGLSTDDTKGAFWGHTTQHAEFGFWFSRTAGRTDNKGVLDVSSDAPYSLSATNMRNKVFRYSHAANPLALTTPTAVDILAEMPAYQVDGDSFLWTCIAEAQNVVLTLGAGVTETTGYTSMTDGQIDSGNCVTWLVRRTGAAAVDLLRLHNAPY